MQFDIATWYLPLRHAHVTLVAGSVALFAMRGAAVLAGASWPMWRPLRLASYGIDTLLLGAGAMLWWMMSLHPLRMPWLGAKLAWLLVYIVLGSFALKRARTSRGRAVAYVAALLCVAFMASIAVAHHPAGALRWIVG